MRSEDKRPNEAEQDSLSLHRMRARPTKKRSTSTFLHGTITHYEIVQVYEAHTPYVRFFHARLRITFSIK